MEYPAEVELSLDEMILHDAEYYIRFVVHDVAITTDDEGAVSNDGVIVDKDYVDGGARYFVQLQKLMTFSHLQMSCHNNVCELRWC